MSGLVMPTNDTWGDYTEASRGRPSGLESLCFISTGAAIGHDGATAYLHTDGLSPRLS
jgi:hypothetical protein